MISQSDSSLEIKRVVSLYFHVKKQGEHTMACGILVTSEIFLSSMYKSTSPEVIFIHRLIIRDRKGGFIK